MAASWSGMKSASAGGVGGGGVYGGGFPGPSGGVMPTIPKFKTAKPLNVNTDIQSNMAKYMKASPVPQAATQAGKAGTQMQNVGSGLMDPNSAYFQKLLGRMKGELGQQGAAQKRAAALTGAESGFGAGGGAEVMQMQGDIDEATMEATGEAAGDLALAAPGVGAQIAGQGAGINLGVAGSTLDARRLAETMREFDVGAGFTAQGLANQANMANQDAMLKMFATMLGGF